MTELDNPTNDDAVPGSDDRRSNMALREVLDELIDHVRVISRDRGTLSPEDSEYKQQRLEWLADEAWRLSSEGGEARQPS